MLGVKFILTGFVPVRHPLFGIDDHGICVGIRVDVDSAVLFSLDVVRVDVRKVMPCGMMIRVVGHFESLDEKVVEGVVIAV